MTATLITGPEYVTGDTQAIPALAAGGPVPDPNPDAGPSGFFQGVAFPDARLWNPKDKVAGFTGVLQHHLPLPFVKSYGGIPSALVSNNIAAVQHVAAGVPMTLAAASTLGVTLNVPLRPLGFALGGNAPVTCNMALDFGFTFGSCTAGSITVTVPDSALFAPGMPLVIGDVGNAAGTVPLLTQVATIASATTITVLAGYVPLATNTGAPIGTGDLWGPNEIPAPPSPGFPLPMAAYPFLAKGPGLFLDPRQALARGIAITGASGSSGGTVLILGWDAYGQPMSDLVTVGAASTGYSLKCFKYINAIIPQFADAHNYSVGTADLFEFSYRSTVWEDTRVFWAGAEMTSVTGWVAADKTSPATQLTGDVRGTIQLTSSGPGSGIGSTASNGSLTLNVISGNRLEISQFLNVPDVLRATQANSASVYGQTQI